MIKYIFIGLIFFNSLLFGSSNKAISLEAKIINSIINNLIFDKDILIYTDDNELYFELSKENSLVDDCKEATLIILKDRSNLPKKCLNKAIFVLDYNLLEKIDSSFGAFFFKKGRANIVFIKPRLEKNHIDLTSKLIPYMEDKIW